MEELEKIDLIRERMGVSYREAREALWEADGDVVQALINLEEEQRAAGRWEQKGREVVGKLKTFVAEGQKRRLRVKKGDRTLAEIPVGAGALGLVGMLLVPELAVLGGLGAIAAMASDVRLEVKEEGGNDREKTAEELPAAAEKKELPAARKDNGRVDF